MTRQSLRTVPACTWHDTVCSFPLPTDAVAWLISPFLLLSTTLATAAPGWDAAASLETARYSHTATLLSNGKVLVAGGVSIRYLSTTELYDPATNAWSAGGTFAAFQPMHTATILLDGKVLIAGGHDGRDPVANAQLYDPATNAWTVAGALVTRRATHTATLLPNGKVLVAGGYDVGERRLASVELYDPATNVWTAAGALSTTRSGHTATLLANGKVLIVGGHLTMATGGSLGVVAPTFIAADPELYDPTTNTSTAAGTLAQGPYAYHSATLLPDGKVLVAGGATGNDYTASAELYDPATNTWTTAGSLAAVRYLHTATLLPNGKVLVAGGATAGSDFTANAELYDPLTNSWTGTAALTLAHRGHTATLLPNGKVLVAGGESIAGGLASAELYNSNFVAPGALIWIPVYRFFNSNAGGHFFTISASEKDTVIASYPQFLYEGAGFYAYGIQYPGTLPVYRFYHDARGHFFTMNAWEKANVIVNFPPYRYEGIAFYAYPSQHDAGTSPVYRFLNADRGGHLYTISASEKDAFIANYSWIRTEGTGFYARSTAD